MRYLQEAIVNENNDLKSAITLLDEWVQHQMHVVHQPGLALGIIHNGELVWGKGYGYADVQSQTPVTLDTRFRIASISKTFTGVAIMQLVEQGQLQLDDPLNKYLTWFDLQYEGAPPITIRQCLTHTSGLPRDGITAIWEDDSFYTWEDVVENTKKRKPILPPVEAFAYSNLAYALLGGVILEITGQRWNGYVQEHILDPLQMSDTLTGARGGEANLATGYLRPDADHQRRGMHVVDAKGYDSATGMASSINDLAKYARFHLSREDHAILSAYSLREMHRPHWTHKKFNGGYGLGIGVNRIDQHTLTGHGGGYKGFLTSFLVNREHGSGFIVLTNAIDSNPMQYAEKAIKLVQPELVKLNAEEKTVDDAWYAYVGRYQSDWIDSRVLIRDNTLQIVFSAFPTEDSIKLIPGDAPHTFITESDSNPGQIVRFEQDGSGKVTRLYIENEYAHRVD